MSVRSKFYVERKVEYSYGYTEIYLKPVFSNDPNHENKKFWDATPYGSLMLGLQNKEATKKFELGEEYYVDFTKVQQ